MSVRFELLLLIGRPWAWAADRWRATGNVWYLLLIYGPMDWWYHPLLKRALRKRGQVVS